MKRASKRPSSLRVHVVLLMLLGVFKYVRAGYLVGTGKADITGPAADVNMLGYASMSQTSHGIHIRQYARAFIVADQDKPSSRVLYISIDAGMPSQLLTMRLTKEFKERYQGLYSIENTVITATHSHSGAGGFQQYLLYGLTGLGFVPQSYNITYNGIAAAVAQAHNSLAPAQLSYSSGEVLGVSINRSPSAYASNPQEERARYKHDTDKDMTLIKIRDPQGSGRGLLAWYGAHPTSMSMSNTLLSGDTYGAAEQFIEKGWGEEAAANGRFVAAMMQANHADTSPNTQGTYCGATDQRCDFSTSTCNGDVTKCFARGPGWPDDMKSTGMHAAKFASAAAEIWDSKQEVPIKGPIDSRHLYFDISNTVVHPSNFTRGGRTCPGAMGWSFAAGTTDGPGMRGFFQSDKIGQSPLFSPLHDIVNGLLIAPITPAQRACHAPKPILLNVGEYDFPYAFVPSVVEATVLRVGNLVTVHASSEFTTMAGRRIRDAVYQTVKDAWGEDVKVLMSSVSNTYSSYATTYEEYQVQRYEGGSTLYGPHTLDAFIQAAVVMATAMVNGEPVNSQVQPPDLMKQQISLVPGVLMDTTPLGSKFGDVVADVRLNYAPGETVEVVFRSANPRNDPRTDSTFLTVEHSKDNNTWGVVHTDDDWCTKFAWSRPSGGAPSESMATISWDIPSYAAEGFYRIQHFGSYKQGPAAPVKPYSGSSSVFQVARPSSTAASQGRQ